MPPSDRNADRSALVPIDWWPDGWRLSAIIRRSRIAENPTAYALGLRRGVTVYNTWGLADPKLAREYGDWVYSGASNLEYGNETMDFSWVPPFPVPEGGQPGDIVEKLVDEWEVFDGYDWPNVLMDLQILVDKMKAAANADNNIPVDRGGWRNGGNRISKKRFRVYASLERPRGKRIEAEEPIPNEIKGDYYGQPIRLPPCLHPDLTLESIASDQAVVYDCTPDQTRERMGNKLFYEATNHLGWQKHVFSNEPKRVDGLWRRIEGVVFPPKQTAIVYV